jgi:hypothetical protein
LTGDGSGWGRPFLDFPSCFCETGAGFFGVVSIRRTPSRARHSASSLGKSSSVMASVISLEEWKFVGGAFLNLGTLQTETGKHRVHEPLLDIILADTAVRTAIEVIRPPAAPRAGRTFPLASSLFKKVWLHIPIDGVLEDAVANNAIGSIILHTDWAGPVEVVQESKTTSFARAQTRLVTGCFVQFVDPWIDWVKDNISTNFHAWPHVCSFARVVRNAAVHGGTINIERETAPSVFVVHAVL